MHTKKVFKTIGICIFTLVVASELVFAGAWTREKGGMYHQLTFNDYNADKNFNIDGDRVDFGSNGKFFDRNFAYYMEYGITDTVTGIGSWAYKWLTYEDDSVRKTTRGLSDLELGLKYRLFSKSGNVVSIQGLVKIPETYKTNDAVPLGNGQYDYEIRLLYGQSLYPHVPGYLNLEAGCRFRAEAPADEFRYLAELGINMTKTIYGRIKLDGILGMGNADDNADGFGNPTTTDDYDLGKLDMALGWKIVPNWGFEIGYRPEIYGKNTASGDNWSVGVWFQMP